MERNDKEHKVGGWQESFYFRGRRKNQGWAGVAGEGAEGRRPAASKVKVLASPLAPWAGSALPLNSRSSAPTSPAFTTISFAAWMVFSAGAVKLPCMISRPSEVTKSQESECKVMRSDSGFGIAGRGEAGFETGGAGAGWFEIGFVEAKLADAVGNDEGWADAGIGGEVLPAS